jgi:acetyl esterase/lipase
LIRSISSHFTGKLTSWQTTVIIFLWLYVSRNFAKIVGLECPEPLANLYSRSFFRATWITTGLDAGFWTAMKIKPKWLRDLASLVFTVYYLIAAEQADEKVRRVRGTLTLEHLRVSWNKATSPYLWFLASLVRPRLTRYGPRAIRIPRPKHSAYTKSVHNEPINAWLYFDGPLSTLKDQTSLVLDVPGGGFVAMGPRNSEDKLLSWAGQLKVPVLSIDYKKAPEFAYPYALHECYDVYHTIMATNGRCIGLSGSTRPRVVVTGESAGGNLAVGMTLMVLQSAQADNALPRPVGLVLAYPALNVRVESWMTDEQMSLIQDKSSRQTNSSVLQRKQDQYRKLTPYTSPGRSVENLTEKQPKHEATETDIAAETSKALRDKLEKSEHISGKAATETNPLKTRLAVSSMISYVHDRILTPEMMRAMVILYIGPHHRPDFNTDFFLSPVLAPDALLAQFPKTYILTGERDPLVDDTVIFAGRLRQAKLHRFHERQDLGLEQRQFNEKDYVEVSLIPGVSHGFMQMAGFFPDAWKYINRSARWIESLFENPDLQSSEYSLLQLSQSQIPNLKPPGRIRGLSQSNANATKNHHRSFTGESSTDDDRPLEMGMSRITPVASSTTDLPLRRRRSKSSFASTQLSGLTTLGNDSSDMHEFRAKLKRLEMSRQDPDFPDEVNSAPESPVAMRPRGRSIASLDSEEDILDRRMNGIAGGLMGLGEGAQTPGA